MDLYAVLDELGNSIPLKQKTYLMQCQVKKKKKKASMRDFPLSLFCFAGAGWDEVPVDRPNCCKTNEPTLHAAASMQHGWF